MNTSNAIRYERERFLLDLSFCDRSDKAESENAFQNSLAPDLAPVSHQPGRSKLMQPTSLHTVLLRHLVQSYHELADKSNHKPGVVLACSS